MSISVDPTYVEKVKLTNTQNTIIWHLALSMHGPIFQPRLRKRTNKTSETNQVHDVSIMAIAEQQKTMNDIQVSCLASYSWSNQQSAMVLFPQVNLPTFAVSLLQHLSFSPPLEKLKMIIGVATSVKKLCLRPTLEADSFCQ